MSATSIDVFAVRREIDLGENAAARAERKAGHVGQLRAGPGAERPPAGSCIRPAHRLHGHGARGDDVLLDEGRRHLQRRRDVVEALGHVVCRQHLARVEVDRQEIPNRVCVFLAIEPVQHDLVRHMRLAGRPIQGLFEPGDQRVDGRGVRLSGAGRRHDAPAQLAHRLLEHVGMLADALRRESLEADAAGLRAVVVTRDAVLLDRGELFVGVGCLRGRRRRPLRSRERRGQCGHEHGDHRNQDRGPCWGSGHASRRFRHRIGVECVTDPIQHDSSVSSVGTFSPRIHWELAGSRIRTGNCPKPSITVSHCAAYG